jgi:anti-anti-sigma regulatory factor
VQMMEAVQLAVERPSAGIVVIRVAGDLDRVSSRRVLTLVEQQLLLARSHPGLAGAHVVVDLSDVRCFGKGGLDTLCDAERVAARAGGQLHVTGLAAREAVLPRRVAELVPHLKTFPTLDLALRQLRSDGRFDRGAPMRPAGRPGIDHRDSLPSGGQVSVACR